MAYTTDKSPDTVGINAGSSVAIALSVCIVALATARLCLHYYYRSLAAHQLPDETTRVPIPPTSPSFPTNDPFAEAMDPIGGTSSSVILPEIPDGARPPLHHH